MLFASAIPQMLLTRINQFLLRTKSEQKIEEFHRLFENTYWTHLHKYPSDNEHKYKKICANTWLKKELENGIGDGVKLIITLGEDVRKWSDKNIKLKIFHK